MDEVLGDGIDDGTDVLGDLRCSSLFTLARDGGLGDGEDLAALGDCLEESLDCPELDFPPLPSIPGMPIIWFIPGSPSPYIAAIFGSMAAMAAMRLEFGFLGSIPRA